MDNKLHFPQHIQNYIQLLLFVMNVELFAWSTQSTLESYVLVVNSTGAGQEAPCMVLCLIRSTKEYRVSCCFGMHASITIACSLKLVTKHEARTCTFTIKLQCPLHGSICPSPV
jgi:hypothetical protein